MGRRKSMTLRKLIDRVNRVSQSKEPWTPELQRKWEALQSQVWVDDLTQRYPQITKEKAHNILREWIERGWIEFAPKDKPTV